MTKKIKDGKNTPNSALWEWNPTTKTYDFVGKGSQTAFYSSDVSGLTYGTGTGFKKDCHTGNTAIYTEPGGGTLYIGGWNNRAVFNENVHVIDLTGTEHKFRELATAFDNVSESFLPFVQTTAAGWLSLPFPDMGVPSNITTYQQWAGIAGIIKGILGNGTDVLVACLGGHGRSGIFCSIVGYILGNQSNPDWASPVAHLRAIHCHDAVETYKQEEYVYQILGLNIPISTVYAQASTNSSACPICGILSLYVKDFGMCMGCKNKFEPIAPIKTDITEDDLKNILEHKCLGQDNCLGIYKAAGCGHTVHDMIIIDGLCENCSAEAEFAKKKGDQDPEPQKEMYGNCAVCGRRSFYGHWYGVCYDCAEDLKKRKAVDFVHNSITDAYSSAPHSCDNVICNGIVVADVCGHVVHDHEIQDGMCGDCQKEKKVSVL